MRHAVESAHRTLGELDNQVKHMFVALERTEVSQSDLLEDLMKVETEMKDIRRKLSSDSEAYLLDYGVKPSVRSRVRWLSYGAFNSTAAPAQSYRDSYAIAQEEFRPLLERLRKLIDVDVKALNEKLQDAGAPFTPNSLPEVPEY